MSFALEFNFPCSSTTCHPNADLPPNSGMEYGVPIHGWCVDDPAATQMTCTGSKKYIKCEAPSKTTSYVDCQCVNNNLIDWGEVNVTITCPAKR